MSRYLNHNFTQRRRGFNFSFKSNTGCFFRPLVKSALRPPPSAQAENEKSALGGGRIFFWGGGQLFRRAENEKSALFPGKRAETGRKINLRPFSRKKGGFFIFRLGRGRRADFTEGPNVGISRFNLSPGGFQRSSKTTLIFGPDVH